MSAPTHSSYIRVLTDVGLGRWASGPYVTLRIGDLEVRLYPDDARATARKLKQAADFVAPPKPRVRKVVKSNDGGGQAG